MSGNNVSHSKRRTKRRFLPNLHKKTFYIEELDMDISLRISNAALRNIDKKGIYPYLKELEAKGDFVFPKK